jgi:hypothetical protein
LNPFLHWGKKKLHPVVWSGNQTSYKKKLILVVIKKKLICLRNHHDFTHKLLWKAKKFFLIVLEWKSREEREKKKQYLSQVVPLLTTCVVKWRGWWNNVNNIKRKMVLDPQGSRTCHPNVTTSSHASTCFSYVN